MDANKKVLIVEDEPILLNVLGDQFKSGGWATVLADNGVRAIEEMKVTKDFALVVLDLLLPEKSGMAVLKNIRADESYKEVPVLILSSLGDDEDVRKAMELGATDYFIKTEHPMSEILEKAAKYLK